ncbi:hypothetical protein PENTCL1PPCAC_514, partial [Pristionchus entomophagus]
EPISIMMDAPGGHRASPKKKSKKRDPSPRPGRSKKSDKPEPIDDGNVEQSQSHLSLTSCASNARAAIDLFPYKKCVGEERVIVSDVTDIKELESVGSRFDDINEKDDAREVSDDHLEMTSFQKKQKKKNS